MKQEKNLKFDFRFDVCDMERQNRSNVSKIKAKEATFERMFDQFFIFYISFFEYVHLVTILDVPLLCKKTKCSAI